MADTAGIAMPTRRQPVRMAALAARFQQEPVSVTAPARKPRVRRAATTAKKAPVKRVNKTKSAAKPASAAEEENPSTESTKKPEEKKRLDFSETGSAGPSSSQPNSAFLEAILASGPVKKTQSERKVNNKRKPRPAAVTTSPKKRKTTPEPVEPPKATADDEALITLSNYLKSIKQPTAEEVLQERRAKLIKDETEYARGKEALQRLALEIQGNMNKLVESQEAASSAARKKEIQVDIDKVTVGSRALIQIGQKMSTQKERLRTDRQLLEEDERKFAEAAEAAAEAARAKKAST